MRSDSFNFLLLKSTPQKRKRKRKRKKQRTFSRNLHQRQQRCREGDYPYREEHLPTPLLLMDAKNREREAREEMLNVNDMMK